MEFLANNRVFQQFVVRIEEQRQKVATGGAAKAMKDSVKMDPKVSKDAKQAVDSVQDKIREVNSYGSKLWKVSLGCRLCASIFLTRMRVCNVRQSMKTSRR